MNENSYYYFFSTVAQTLAAAFAVLGAFYLVTMQRMPHPNDPGNKAERLRIAYKHHAAFGSLSVLVVLALVVTALTILLALLGISLAPGCWQTRWLFFYFLVVFIGTGLSLTGIILLITRAIAINIDFDSPHP